MWPKGPFMWKEDRTIYVSVPFTWNLPKLKRYLEMGAPSWDNAIVGGPAVKLMSEYLVGIPNVTVSTADIPGVLQRVNPLATRTTVGCIRHCNFCGIGSGVIEPGGFRELGDWPNLPIICDNNILASSFGHFSEVIDRLSHQPSPDFNQGLDARLLQDYHAYLLSKLRNPTIRLALDSSNPIHQKNWARKVCMLRRWNVKNLTCYVLIGLNTGPREAWDRCEFVKSHKVRPDPMWFHALDALLWNEVTLEQRELGWTKYEQRKIMGYYYKHRGTVGP
jgi:hypothetical protein